MRTNRVEFLVAVHAISKLGAAAVLLSPAWKAAEVGHALGSPAPVHAVADGPAVELLAERLGADAVTDLDDARRLGAAATDAARRPATSAPTTRPSSCSARAPPGCPRRCATPTARSGAGTAHWVAALGLTADDRFQVATPPSHILGLLNLLAAAEAGATVRLHPRFDLDEVLRRIESDRITLEMAVAPDRPGHGQPPRPRALRPLVAPLHHVGRHAGHRERRRGRHRRAPACGGCRPTAPASCPVLACNPVDRPDAWRLDSAGLPGRRASSSASSTSTPARVLEPGGVGEIQARSPSVMAGYLPEEANADAFADGWYRTGDVGWLEPEGWVHLTDRSKEMIKVKGFQVAPAEIEAVLHGHPAVRRLRRVRRSPTSGPARCPSPPCSSTRTDPSTRRSSSSSWPTRSPPTSSCATSWSSTPSPACRRARCCAARSATSGRRSCTGAAA